MPYTLGAKCGAELLGMMVSIWFAQNCVACELLPRSKGNNMGWGWLSLGYGLGFGFSIALFGPISAYFNPALMLSAWILGDIDARTYWALAASQMVGAFLGGVLTWLQFLPHFNVVPEKPDPKKLMSPRHLEARNRRRMREQDNAINVASYDPSDILADMSSEDAVQGVLAYFRHKPKEATEAAAHGDPQVVYERAMEHVGQERRRTMSTAAVLDPETLEAGPPKGSPFPAEVHKDRAPSSDPPPPAHGFIPLKRALSNLMPIAHEEDDTELEEVKEDAQRSQAEIEAWRQYRGDVRADQALKLGCFTTRPAIYCPWANWLCEFMATISLIVVLLSAAKLLANVYEPGSPTYVLVNAAFAATYIFFLVLAPGGPTGVAMSPSRDFGPRLAHFLLPIPGKGSSEIRRYAWVPASASMVGGVVGAYITKAVLELLQSGTSDYIWAV